MFYFCPKCKKIWQYPIEKCPDCFLELKGRSSEKLKVIGISKVTISTILHPKVPYFVLVLEDERGNKFVQKSVKEYKIGDQFEFKVVRNKGAVAIWRVKYDIYEAIEKIINFLGEIEIKEDTKILILPTLISPTHPYFCQNTHPEVLNSLIKFLIERGAKKENLKIAGQSFTEIPIEASAQKSQLLKVCQDFKVLPLDLAKTNFIKRNRGDFNFEISEELFNSDLIINLPILKLDSKLGVRGAMENLTRFLKKENYLSLKYLHNEEEIIMKFKDILPEILNIADGTFIQKSNSQTAFLDLILASFNSLNLDRVFAEIAMISLPEYLKSVKIENIEILGREIGEVQYDLEKV